MRADTDANASAVHTNMNTAADTDASAAVHPDMDVNVRAAVRNVPAAMTTVPGMTTMAAAVTTTMTATAVALSLRRGGGRAQHHNRCTNCGNAIHPGKGADRQRTRQQLTRSHDTSPFRNDRVTELSVAGAHPV